MTKFVVVFDDNDGTDPNGEKFKSFLRQQLPMENFQIYPLYREGYDIDYNMTIFRCLPPVSDPQPILADDEYEFTIGLTTTPENFERIQHDVEHFLAARSVSYLSYTSKGKSVRDGT